MNNQNISKACLIILDGLGLNPNPTGNAVANAATPCLDSLLSNKPNATLITFGKRVGLPEGQMGNSEVGHLNIGAGRVVKQSLVRIADDLCAEVLNEKEAYQAWRNNLHQDSNIHLIGLMSDGGVHSHIDHLKKLLGILTADTLISAKIWLHLITDGRDTSPTSGSAFLEEIQQYLASEQTNPGQRIEIATISGRYYAMDRDQRWERVKLAYQTIMQAANRSAVSPEEFIKGNYAQETTDEYIIPASFNDYPGVHNNDAAIFFNFRADRMRQLVQACCNSDFAPFLVPKQFSTTSTITFSKYENDSPIACLFPAQSIEQHIGAVVASYNLKQLRAAETEKYPHVTYFFNGGVEAPFPAEDRILVPSPKDVATYDLKPEMSAYELTDQVIKKLHEDDYSFCVINYANCDMVGHTGVLEAATKAVETVDICVTKLLSFLVEHNWSVLIIADHGNAEQMIDYTTNLPHTAHTTYPVPVILANVSAEKQQAQTNLRTDGALCDVAPTLLDLMGLARPEAMEGKSLLASLA